MIALTSDRGLCGGVHSSVSKKIKAHMAKEADPSKVKIITIGDKAKAMLARYVLLSGNRHELVILIRQMPCFCFSTDNTRTTF
jgi:F-type H+-transporting ATPase subunit gamma